MKDKYEEINVRASVDMGLNTQDIENIGQALYQIADSLGIKEPNKDWSHRRNILDGLDNIANGLYAVASAINNKETK